LKIGLTCYFHWLLRDERGVNGRFSGISGFSRYGAGHVKPLNWNHKIMTEVTLTFVKMPVLTNPTFLERLVARLRRSRNVVATRKHMLGLDDRMLRDVGLSRGDVMNNIFTRQ
jgi:uncharacterized protein YjiS (DUF1127 family)